MRFHSQNLTDDRLPLWRDGRAWLGNWGVQWGIFRWHSWFSIQASKGGYEGNRLAAHVAVPWFHLFVHRSCARRFRDSQWGAYWYHGSLALLLGASEDRDWKGWRGWHKRPVYLPVKHWVTGKPVCETVKGEPIDVLVPMPEGCYPAVVTPETRTWTYRFGYQVSRTDYWLEVTHRGGIPHAGKGENSYDCGDDGLCGIGGDSVEHVIGRAVARVLKSRRRYGNAGCLRSREPVMAFPATTGTPTPGAP
jgi:hypothetical protein